VSQSSNRILNALPQEVVAALQPHLKVVDLTFGEVISEAEQHVSKVYFPHLGIISLVVEMEVGDMIETAMIGRDGVVNATSALDGEISLHKGIVQVGGVASAISSDALRAVADRFGQFRSVLIRHEQVLLAQTQQSAGCNASHSVEARMCRWLLRIRDLTMSDDMMLTREFLAQMLGVARTSVSVVASTLQTAGWIKYSRGNIQITDVEGLKSGSCECYDRVFSHYERLLAP
jgi:CRP-like cAMP-binding protein